LRYNHRIIEDIAQNEEGQHDGFTIFFKDNH
jgi:hypothetical protein